MKLKTINVSQVFEHRGNVEFDVWAVQGEGARHKEFIGWGRLTVSTGAASMSIDLKPEQMRDLAAALVAQSWEIEG